MMRWDNGPIPKGETRSHLIGLNDLFATLCNLAGVDVPEGQATDSLSFADFIQNPNKTDNLRKHMGVWTYRAGVLQEESIVRKDKLKLIRRVEDGQMQLFDVENDISESKNLIDDDSYKEDVNEMLITMKKIGPCYDTEDNFIVLEKNGTSRETNCEWFREKISRVRCNNYHEAQIQCRHTCSLKGPNSNVCSLKPLNISDQDESSILERLTQDESSALKLSAAQDENRAKDTIEIINGSVLSREENVILVGLMTGMLITMTLHFKINNTRR